MRVSDVEREAAAAELQEHFASGRLDQDELNERLAAAFAAKTRGDLDAVFTDLPSSGHGWTSADAPGGRAAWSQGPFGTDGPQNAQSGWQAGGNAWRAPMGAGIARLVFATIMVWVLLIVGLIGIFGSGGGRPFGIVMIFAALALLRRLLLMIFGRRRGGGRGPRRGSRRRR